MRSPSFSTICLMTILAISGCNQADEASQQSSSESTSVDQVSAAGGEPVADEQAALESTEEQPAAFPTITLGDDTSDATSSEPHRSKAVTQTVADRNDAIIDKLDDLQILLGTWRGITQKTKNIDETNWVWDFQTEPKQPALLMESNANPYLNHARLTYLPESSEYQLTLAGDDETRVLTGQFSEEIRSEIGDNDQPQKTYKLELTDPAEEDRGIRLVFNQQNNNRYLLEVYEQRRPGDRFFRIDTVSTQRQGTSMALIDEGYGEKTCIISGGLGTIQVSYQGKGYYVCCSGCKAAFEDDPERWIARANQD